MRHLDSPILGPGSLKRCMMTVSRDNIAVQPLISRIGSEEFNDYRSILMRIYIDSQSELGHMYVNVCYVWTRSWLLKSNCLARAQQTAILHRTTAKPTESLYSQLTGSCSLAIHTVLVCWKSLWSGVSKRESPGEDTMWFYLGPAIG